MQKARPRASVLVSAPPELLGWCSATPSTYPDVETGYHHLPGGRDNGDVLTHDALFHIHHLAWREGVRQREGGGALPHLLLASVGPHPPAAHQCVVSPCFPCCARGWGEGQCLFLPCSAPQRQLQCLGPLPQRTAPQPLLHSGATLHLFCKEKSWPGLLLWKGGQWGPQLAREALQGTLGSGGRAGTRGASLGRATLPRICRGPSTRTPDFTMAPDPACASSDSPGLLKRHCRTSSNTWNIS